METKLYIDSVSKNIISILSDNIGHNLGRQINDQNKIFLLKELPGIILKEFRDQAGLLGQKIFSIEEKTKLLINDFGSEIKKYFDKNIEKK